MKKINNMNYTISIKDKDYNVKIERKKIKRIIIRINNLYEILVNAPEHISYEEILNKVFLNTNWIEKQIAKHDKINNEFSVQDFLDKKVIYLLGVKYNLILDMDLNNKYFQVDNLFFYKNNIEKTIDLIYRDHYHLLEEQFYQVYDIFKNLVKQSPIIRLQTMKSRWGSCNYNTGRIVLNKMLISLPVELINYVIVHEFTHLIFPNHSKEYYNYLCIILPDYKKLEKKLKKYSFLLAK